MAKRFIDTNIFKKTFTRGLQGAYKLLWIYIMTDCDHAGIWECDIDVASLRIGETIDKVKALEYFSGRIKEISDGTKWFIPSFIEFQYGKLSNTNRAHNGVISLLSKYDLINEELEVKPLASPLQGGKDKEQDKDKEKEEVNTGIIIPMGQEKKIKKAARENVLMFDAELDKLIKTHGSEKTDWMLDKLQHYKNSNGKKYKSDYDAILNWVVGKAEVEFKPKDSNRPMGKTNQLGGSSFVPQTTQKYGN